MTWTTKTTIKTLQGISDSSLDSVIDLLISQAEELVKGYLQREIEQASYTEYYSGTGTPVLVLNQSPVQSVTSVYIDPKGYYGDGTDAFPESSLLVSGTDYVLRKNNASATEVSDSGILYRLGTDWNRPQKTQRGQLARSPGIGKGNIKVAYIAGWERPVPPAGKGAHNPGDHVEDLLTQTSVGVEQALSGVLVAVTRNNTRLEDTINNSELMQGYYA